jgi:hypothetical protein
MPSGVQPLSPDDVGRLTGAGVSTIKDTQLAKALELVSAERVASRG